MNTLLGCSPLACRRSGCTLKPEVVLLPGGAAGLWSALARSPRALPEPHTTLIHALTATLFICDRPKVDHSVTFLVPPFDSADVFMPSYITDTTAVYASVRWRLFCLRIVRLRRQ